MNTIPRAQVMITMIPQIRVRVVSSQIRSRKRFCKIVCALILGSVAMCLIVRSGSEKRSTKMASSYIHLPFCRTKTKLDSRSLVPLEQGSQLLLVIFIKSEQKFT